MVVKKIRGHNSDSVEKQPQTKVGFLLQIARRGTSKNPSSRSDWSFDPLKKGHESEKPSGAYAKKAGVLSTLPSITNISAPIQARRM